MTKRQHPKHTAPVTRLHPARRPPPPPDHLEPPERELWDHLVAVYTFEDHASLELLAAMCEARMRRRRCREAIDRDGETWRDHRGNLRPHPLLSAERSARQSFQQSMRMLRLDMGDVK